MKKVREGYNQTKIGEIPNDWMVDKLGNKAYIKARIGWRGLSSDEYTDVGPYLVAGKHIKGSKILWNECDHISIERYNESSEIMLKEKDIIMTKDGTIGRVGFIDKLNGKATINGTMMLIRPNEDLFYSKFLYYYFQGENFKKIINEKISGSSIPHIFQRDMVNLEVPIPSINEQEKIASILSTVDEQIDNVDALIEKSKELKKGLMQQLLTKGIGHTRFKKTEIGDIPKEWEVKKLGDICDVRGGKRLPKGYQLEDENNGFPYIRVADMYMGGVKLEDIKYVPKEVVEKIKNYKISKNDLFISVAGTIGIVGKIPEALDGANLTENADKLCDIKINKLYLMKVLQSELVQSIIDSEKTTNAQPKLALTRIKEFLIPVPSNEEQKKIASILSEVDEKIEKYENKKEKLEELKKGLMQQLLTGKIRVI